MTGCFLGKAPLPDEPFFGCVVYQYCDVRRDNEGVTLGEFCFLESIDVMSDNEVVPGNQIESFCKVYLGT